MRLFPLLQLSLRGLNPVLRGLSITLSFELVIPLLAKNMPSRYRCVRPFILSCFRSWCKSNVCSGISGSDEEDVDC